MNQKPERIILTYTCSRCRPVKVLILKDIEKAEILAKRQDLGTIKTIKFIFDSYKLNLGDAKNLIHHINYKKGKCLVCKVSDIEVENQNCSNCGRFTLN